MTVWPRSSSILTVLFAMSGSSSTTRMVATLTGVTFDEFGIARTEAGFDATGSHRVAVVPLPTWLVSWRRPPSCTTSPSTIDKPRPVPFPTGLVEKNGSMAFLSVSSSMPDPVSDRDKRTKSLELLSCPEALPARRTLI